MYYDVKPTYMYEAQACNCALPEVEGHGCGEDCINRLVYAECSPQLCPCKDRCSNQRIQKHEWAPGLDKFMTKDKVSSKMEFGSVGQILIISHVLFSCFVRIYGCRYNW